MIFQVLILIFISTSLVVGLYLFNKGSSSIHDSEAAFNYNRESYFSGSIRNISFYRTNFAIEEQNVYARSTDTPLGFYDNVSNKTYIVYGGGQYDGKTPVDYLQLEREGRLPWLTKPIDYKISATDPYILAYDHNARRWEGPVRLGSMGDSKDSHNFPQVVMDKNGYIHVFYSLHSGNDIYQFISERPRDISKWRLKIIPNTPHSYVVPFVDNEGEMYLFFRSYPNYQCDLDKDGVWGEREDDNWISRCGDDPEQARRWCLFYEPQVYIKSTDNGQTWSPRKVLIDPGVPSRPADVNTSGSPDCRVVDSPTIQFPEREQTLNVTGYQTTYVPSYAHDQKNNRVWLSFIMSRWHGAGGGHRFTNPYLISFDFRTDTISSIDGRNFGQTLTRTEYLEKELNNNQGMECCTAVKMRVPLNVPRNFKNRNNLAQGRGGLRAALVIENLNTGIPTVFYNDWITNRRPNEPEYFYDGVSYVYKRVWNGRSWDETRLDRVGDVVSLLNAEYRPSVGTFLYVKNFDGILISKSIGYQYPAKIFSSVDNYSAGIRIFSSNINWEQRGIANLAVIRNSHPDIRATFGVPKYNIALPSHGFMVPPSIGAYYIIGDNPLVRVSPTPTPSQCQPVACTSWETVRIGNCSLSDWQRSPLPSQCIIRNSVVKVFPDIAFIKNSASGATMMRYINIDPKIYCNTVSSSDPNWSNWEDYSDYKYWKLTQGNGDKKVCVQYKNICGQESPICGAMIRKESSTTSSSARTSSSLDFSTFQSSQFINLNEYNFNFVE